MSENKPTPSKLSSNYKKHIKELKQVMSIFFDKHDQIMQSLTLFYFSWNDRFVKITDHEFTYGI